jgi:hypothetical protein
MRQGLVHTLLVLGAGIGLVGIHAGCGGEGEPPVGAVEDAPDVLVGPETFSLDAASILDPVECAECHPRHYEEWAGSMHAYASFDPVFIAMNQRGQRETNGALGDFCVGCHAPMAVRLGLTDDGSNLEDLPDHVQGVTCYFCHAVESVDGTHNAKLTLASDGVMRGAYDDPVPNTAHASAYSTLHDRNHMDSAGLCGTCHDIVTPPPHEVHLERTFAEWEDSLYSNPVPGQQQTCGACHMGGSDNTAADAPGVKLRTVHDHRMPGVDLAITDFPDMETQRAEVEYALASTVFSRVCVSQSEGEHVISVRLENIAAGHAFPSGAAQDRRVWVELVAQGEAGETLLESGVIPEDVPVAMAELDDVNLWRMGDRTFDTEGNEAHMFWDVASVESEILPAPTAFSPLDPGYIQTHRTRKYIYAGPAPETITLEVHMRAVGLDVLQDLVDSGDLDPVHIDAFETLTLANASVTWLAENDSTCQPPDHGSLGP